jgi:hypothetical protein
VISARGRTITLLDGSSVTLVYGFMSIMQLEDEFGSLEAAMKSLSEEVKLGTIAKIMAAGLLHETHPTAGVLGEIAGLAPLLDTLEIETYSEAIGEAFEAAFPQPVDGQHKGDEPDPTVPVSSPGSSGGTPPQSSSDAAMQSSGV